MAWAYLSMLFIVPPPPKGGTAPVTTDQRRLPMNSAADIWERVLSLMKQTMTETTITTWFSDAEPVALDENRFILYVPTDFKREIVVSRYLKDIKKALYDLFSEDLDVVVLSEDEKDKYAKKEPPSRFLPGTEEYTFERFVVGNSNKLAHAAALAVAEHPAENYNPLFIHGESGLGKTHLLYAIAHTIHKNHPDYKIVYIRGEDFTNELIRDIRAGKNQEFRAKYRSADVFLMDDVQFIAGRDSTQEEMFHTFNTLYEDKKQIVFTADRPPKEMLRLEDRLKTRFEWGLTADVQPPDFETRMAIIKRKAELVGLSVPDNVCEFIAQKLKSNIRQLEGTVKKLNAIHLVEDATPTISTAQRAISDIVNNEQPAPVTVSKIIEEVGRTYGVSPEDIKSSKRNANVSFARQISMYVVREITQMPMVEIGKEFGGRDHSTVVYAIQQIEEKSARDPVTKATVSDIIKNIRDR